MVYSAHLLALTVTKWELIWNFVSLFILFCFQCFLESKNIVKGKSKYLFWYCVVNTDNFFFLDVYNIHTSKWYSMARQDIFDFFLFSFRSWHFQYFLSDKRSRTPLHTQNNHEIMFLVFIFVVVVFSRICMNLFYVCLHRKRQNTIFAFFFLFGFSSIHFILSTDNILVFIRMPRRCLYLVFSLKLFFFFMR